MFIKLATNKEKILINLRNVVTIECRSNELTIVLNAPSEIRGSYRLSYTCANEEIAMSEFKRIETELTQLGEVSALPGSKVV